MAQPQGPDNAPRLVEATTRRQPRAKPDPRPSRLIMGAGALAAITVIGAGLVQFPVATGGASSPISEVASATHTTASRSKTKTTVKVQRPVRYVHLKPGQKAPPGAKVIQAAAPAPRVIVRRVAAPQTVVTTTRPRIVTRTRQSGR